jgi:hypothetical protein
VWPVRHGCILGWFVWSGGLGRGGGLLALAAGCVRVGGIRHEDTVVVTEQGCENLCPKWSGTPEEPAVV